MNHWSEAVAKRMANESKAPCQLRELKAPNWDFMTLSPQTPLGEPPHKTKKQLGGRVEKQKRRDEIKRKAD